MASDVVGTNAVPLASEAPVAAPATDQKSIAVLAFANLSEDKGNEYFSDGISEELLTVLQKIPGLHGVARKPTRRCWNSRNCTRNWQPGKLPRCMLTEVKPIQRSLGWTAPTVSATPEWQW